MLLALVVSILIFWEGGSWLHIPLFPRHEVSLLQMPGGVVRLAWVAALAWGATALGTFIARSVRFDAGVFAAGVGLAALSTRAGPMGETLRTAADASAEPTIYLTLVVELAALYAVVGAAWVVLWWLHPSERLPKWAPPLPADERLDELRADGIGIGERKDHAGTSALPPTFAAKLGALGVTALASGLILMLLARSDNKAQVMIGVLVASAVATVLAYALYPVRPAGWYLLAPLVVGFVGYLSGRFGADDAWRIGQPHFLLAPLARPSPLDYAGLGSAGAIFGYWLARHWQQEQEDESAAGVEETA